MEGLRVALEPAGTHPNLKEKLQNGVKLTQREVLASENPWCFDNNMCMEQRVQDGYKYYDGMKQLVDATNASFNQAHKRIDSLEKANKTKTKMTNLEKEGWSTGLDLGERLIGMTFSSAAMFALKRGTMGPELAADEREHFEMNVMTHGNTVATEDDWFKRRHVAYKGEGDKRQRVEPTAEELVWDQIRWNSASLDGAGQAFVLNKMAKELARTVKTFTQDNGKYQETAKCLLCGLVMHHFHDKEGNCEALMDKDVERKDKKQK